MDLFRRFSTRRAAAALLAGGLALGASESAAQSASTRPRETVSASAGGALRSRVRSEALANGRYVVVVDLDANRLYFARGRRVLWSAPVGTGTGLRLETDRDSWDFSTPNGTYSVQFKEKDPVWVAPDWYFIENGLPIPPRESPRRRFPGGLGAAAVYLGHGLAIHGTDKPELLGQRVSHGCIRLSNRDAIRLFHNVQPGTEVVIVGGPDEPAEPAQTAATRPARRSGSSTPPRRDPFLASMEELSTPSLLERLDEELFASAAAPGTVRWPTVASVLVSRGAREDDDMALEGLLGRVGTLGRGALREEFGTVLADAYHQGTLRTLDALGRLDRVERMRAAEAIVESTLLLYPGELSGVVTPWPTRRAPREALEGTAQRGWDALQTVEQRHRERLGLATARPPSAGGM